MGKNSQNKIALTLYRILRLIRDLFLWTQGVAVSCVGVVLGLRPALLAQSDVADDTAHRRSLATRPLAVASLLAPHRIMSERAQFLPGQLLNIHNMLHLVQQPSSQVLAKLFVGHIAHPTAVLMRPHQVRIEYHRVERSKHHRGLRGPKNQI